MTVEQFIRRRFFGGWIALAVYFVFVGVVIMPGLMMDKRLLHQYPWLPFLAVLPFGGVGITLNLCIRCPRCKGNLGASTAPWLMDTPFRKRAPVCSPFWLAKLATSLSELLPSGSI